MAPCSATAPFQTPRSHLHCLSGRVLVTHQVDLVGLGANELNAVVRADVHERSTLRQEAVALGSKSNPTHRK